MKFNDQQIAKISKEVQNIVKGKVLFDHFSRGRYSTDSSLYQITPIGAVLPKDQNDVLNLMEYSQKISILYWQEAVGVRSVVKPLVKVLF